MSPPGGAWSTLHFVIDVFARLHCWLASLELAQDGSGPGCTGAGVVFARTGTKGLIHHSDRGSQYLSIRYTERLAEAGIESSVGSVGDSYDNAMAETIIGLVQNRSYLAAWAVEKYRCRSNTQRCNGWTGSIIGGYWSRSATFHLQSSSRRIMINWKVRLLRPDSHKRVSGIPGAVQ